MEGVREIGGLKVIGVRGETGDPALLHDAAILACQQVDGPDVVCIAGAAGDKSCLVVAVNRNRAGKVHAGNLLYRLNELVGGSGGGTSVYAQARVAVDKLDTALESIYDVVKEALEEGGEL